MTKFNGVLAPDPAWSYNESKDFLVTIGGVNFRLSEYAGASIQGSNTKVVLASGKELIAHIGFYEFVEFIESEINKNT